jgi:glycosyltransferase involved in cell wall biosynthesis
LKIFIAVHHYPPSFSGGAELRAHRTAQSLQKRGHTVQAFAIERINEGPDHGISWVDEVYEGIPVRKISFNRAATPDWFTYSYNNPWIGDHLKTFLSEFQPQIFHLFGGYLQSASTILAAVNLNIPTVLSLTDYWFLCQQIQMISLNNQVCKNHNDPACCLKCYSEERRRYRWLGRFFPGLMQSYWKLQKKDIQRFVIRKEFLMNTLNKVDAIIAPSHFIGELHIKSGLQREKVICARQGRTIPNLNSATIAKKPSGHLRLAYIGQVIESKGVHILLEAIRLLPKTPLSLEIYGDLSKRPVYVRKLQQIAGQDPRVRFIGLFQQEQVSQVFHELDAVVVPSLWYENSPNVILEAYAHHTPVLASNLGALPELVLDEKCGLLFVAGNPLSLARQISRLINDPGLLSRLASGIQPVKTEQQELDELEGIYRKLVKARVPVLD